MVWKNGALVDVKGVLWLLDVLLRWFQCYRLCWVKKMVNNEMKWFVMKRGWVSLMEEGVSSKKEEESWRDVKDDNCYVTMLCWE